MSDPTHPPRRLDRSIERMIELWPLWLTLAGGLVTAINFYGTVTSLAKDQAAWKASSESRREKTRDEVEALKNRLSVAENNIEWIKRHQGGTHGQHQDVVD